MKKYYESRLLQEFMNPEIWKEEIDKGVRKGIDKGRLMRFCDYNVRIALYKRIVSGHYEVSVPHVALIPKDKPGEFREVKVNEPEDRVILSVINECLFRLFPDMVHKSCRSYQKGMGTQDTVQKISNKIQKIGGTTHKFIGYKADLSKYFDSVDRDKIFEIFNRLEDQLGFEHGTEPVINVLRKYYNLDWLFDTDGQLIQKYTSLKQGCAVAAFLADVMLYDIDEWETKHNDIYIRYSDDILIVNNDENKSELGVDALKRMLSHYGLTLNPRKVQKLYADEWFTFLGFKIKSDMITLSRNRVKNFQKEVVKRTLKSKSSAKNAWNSLVNYLYSGDYNWATSCLSIVNCEPDIDELNKFILDCLRACEVRDKEVARKKSSRRYPIKITEIGGLGSVENLEDRTILRGTGKRVRTNRERTKKMFDKYVSVRCLEKDMKIGKWLFESVVRGI